MGHFTDNGLDAEPPTSTPGLVSWRYLNYLGPETSPAPLTDDLTFGDKLWPTKSTESGPRPQPVFHLSPPVTLAPEIISLPPASLAIPEEDRSRPDIVPVLNNRKFMGDSFNWAQFES